MHLLCLYIVHTANLKNIYYSALNQKVLHLSIIRIKINKKFQFKNTKTTLICIKINAKIEVLLLHL